VYKVTVLVNRRRSILDPQGKAVELGAKQLGLTDVINVRVDKKITFQINTEDEAVARKEAEQLADKLLANPITEDFEVSLEKIV